MIGIHCGVETVVSPRKRELDAPVVPRTAQFAIADAPIGVT
jgi:hypothetical protein